jgi:hypothetical protein
VLVALLLGTLGVVGYFGYEFHKRGMLSLPASTQPTAATQNTAPEPQPVLTGARR